MGQSLARILTHIIFSTKDRKEFILPEIEAELHPYLAAVFREMESPILALGGNNDHIYALCLLSKNKALMEVLQAVKHSSSVWIKSKGPRYAGFHWQNGYGAFSIGESNVAALKKYIANQKQHHRRTTFQDEFRIFLKRYKMECDERYVWD